MKPLILVTLVFGSVLMGCSTLAKTFRQPLPELAGVTAREDLGLDYKVHVDCTVLNKGAAGNIDVFAELNMDGYWKKRQQVFVPEDGTHTVTFTFTEPTFLNGGLKGGSYSCGF